jgi:FkbM family methyltransferase
VRVSSQPSERQPIRPFRAIGRPEYFFRPWQIWRRLLKGSLCSRNAVQLAWGLPVQVDPNSNVGIDVLNLGVYDRVVSEAICRLLDPGEQAFDIGANVGQNASMMALVLGPRGRVVAFEPGPAAGRLLTRNIESWVHYDLAPIAVVRQGVSSRIGEGLLHESLDLGGFSLEDRAPGPPRIAPDDAPGIKIELTTLDAFAPRPTEIGLIKIDVEGHELAVLEGAAELLGQKRVRDIVFEDYHPQPSPVTMRLQAAGYVVFSLLPAWRKPILLTLEQLSRRPRKEYDLANFLGTRDPERARARFEGAGWKCLRLRARRGTRRPSLTK